ncbi:hypothetical protein [Spiroplasma floricola]|uniref:Uncharacterized protein n=1 Tax=Spiroplasma floricola 23-6 TaxID=1336749 RepID=A0A2K8SCF0_9MOLU|nr:hypothetical protein [Spiroplasma floricola]AUB31141.1 hypothetical protein SFLOR_v1c00800 [Spiroplasma floricola 23-6]
MRNAAYILCIISTVLCSWMLIPMAWMIPMTLAAKKVLVMVNNILL